MRTREKLKKRQKEDQALNRLLLWFGGAVFLELLVLLINRFYIQYDGAATDLAYALGIVIVVATWIGAAAAVAGCVFWVKSRMVGGRSVVPVVVTVAGAMVAVCCFVTLQWQGPGARVLYTLIPVAAVLALIYYLYQKEFFVVALLSGGALLSTWLLWKAAGVVDLPVYIVCGLTAILTLFMAILARALQIGDGQLTLKGKKLRIFPKKATYSCIYITCGVTAAILAAGLIFGATVAYAAIFVVVAWIFIMAVYYTVRLM